MLARLSDENNFELEILKNKQKHLLTADYHKRQYVDQLPHVTLQKKQELQAVELLVKSAIEKRNELS